MRPPTPLTLNLSLNLLGVLSLALATNTAEASSLPTDTEQCGSCDGNRRPTEPTQAQKPAPGRVATRPARPEAKTTPSFSLALAPSQFEDEVAATPFTEPSASQPILPPAPTPQPQPQPITDHSLSEPVARASAPEVALAKAPTPAPQATLAPSVADDSSVNQETSLTHSERAVPVAEPAGATQAAAQALPVTPSLPTSPPQTTTVSLPAFVESAHSTRPSQAARAVSPRPRVRQAASQPPSTSPRQRASSQRVTQKRLSLPQLASQPELPATDVRSIWDRFIPVAIAPASQNWGQGLPTEAMPATTVQTPASLPAARRQRLTTAAPITVDRAQHLAPPAPTLPNLELPRPIARADHAPAPNPRPAIAAQAEALRTTPLASPGRAVAQANRQPAPTLREELLIEPLATDSVATVRYPPSPNAGIPSAFGAAWGDLFVSLTAAGADRLRPEVDGSLSAGFGLGNPRTAVGVELAYNLLSLRNFAENGSFDAKVHREVFADNTTQAAVAVGWNNFATYGTDAAGSESSVYGVVSAAHLLQPDNPVNRLPITGTLGIGGGYFSNDNSDVGVIAGVGLQVDPRLSLNAAWSGVGLNLGASTVPFSTLPLTLNFVYGDVTNNTDAGSVATFTVGYGFNFGPRF